MPENIHPIFDRMLARGAKEGLLGQRSVVLWFTGLSGSGKSTLAHNLEKVLFDQGRMTMLLDGDNVRSGLNNNLGFSDADRQENIRRIAEVARLFKDNGVITLCSFVSPTVQIREMAREIIGAADFLEIFVDAPLEVCEARDVKGLYKKARAGEIKDFTGIDAPFEAPPNPFLTVNTADDDLDSCLRQILQAISSKIAPKN